MVDKEFVLVTLCVFILFFSLFLSIFLETRLIKMNNHVYKKTYNNIVCLDCCK